MIYVSIISDPITMVKGRTMELPLEFYSDYDQKTGTGTLAAELADYVDFVCDFKYNIFDTNALFTLTGPDSPADILYEVGKLTLVISVSNSNLVTIDANDYLTLNGLPMRKLWFEIKGIKADATTHSLAIGCFNVLMKVTTSDE